MNWKTATTVGAGITLALGIQGNVLADFEQKTWRFGLEEIEGSVQHAWATGFKEKIEEASDGAITVQIFPYGQLGGLTDIYEQVQDGDIQLGFGSGFLGGTVPESQIMSLHFIWSDSEEINNQVLNSDEFLKSDALIDSYRARNLHPLAMVPEGWQVWSANEENRTPEDWDGVRIRVMDNRLLNEQYEAYGADPTSVEYGELYSALQLGIADAAVQPLFAHQEMGFYEVQDYLINPRHLPFMASVMSNAQWFDSLSDAELEIIEEARMELVDEVHEVQQQFNEERLQQMLDDSSVSTEYVELTAEERAAFRERQIPVRDTFVEMTGERGEELMNIILRLVEEAE
jgi:C4-dicarboxylate-binding protein DctP